jgi:hypothetical protein
MKTSNLLLVLMTTAGLSLAGAGEAATMGKDARDAAYKNAAAQYKTDKEACKSLAGNAKDICMEEAKGKEKVAKADADAAYKNTPKARESARVAHADASYNVAKEKCDDQTGNAKDVCVKEAKAAHVRAKADARSIVSRRHEQDRGGENGWAPRCGGGQAGCRPQGRDRECDLPAGGARTACVQNAKARYGKS